MNRTTRITKVIGGLGLLGLLAACPAEGELAVFIENRSASTASVAVQSGAAREELEVGACDIGELSFRSDVWEIQVNDEVVYDSIHGASDSAVLIEIAKDGSVNVVPDQNSDGPQPLEC